MALEEHESVAAAPWLQGGAPDAAGIAIERMPGLGFALEQFSLSVTDALAPFCKASSPGAVDELRATNVFTILGECEGLAAAALNCAALEARMLMIFDDRIADTIVGAVLGADGQAATPPRGRQTRTVIENGLIAEFARHLTRALVKGFEQNGGLDLAFERLETLGDLHTLGRRDMPAVAAKVTVDTQGGAASLTLLFPQSLLLPMRKSLTFDPGAESRTSDPRWMRDLQAGVTKTPITVTAILEQFEMSLGELADLAVGQVLSLQGIGMGRVRLECAGREIFLCKLGEGDGKYSLEVEEAIVQEDEAGLASLR